MNRSRVRFPWAALPQKALERMLGGLLLSPPRSYRERMAATLGVLLTPAGAAVLPAAFARFPRADGTPAPPMPTAHLVIVGPYRFVRNPMYLAVLAIILGQALLFRSGGTLLYAGIVLVAV